MHDLDRCVVNAVALARLRVEGLQEVFVKIEDWIPPARRCNKDFRREAVDRVAHHLEADADILHDLIEAQHAQSRPHQWMFLGHVLPGVRFHVSAGPLAHQQQPEGECLREGSREQSIEIGGGVTSSFGVGVEDVPELLPHLQKRVMRIAVFVEFSQPAPHDAANEAGGMRHQCGKMLGIARNWLLPRTRTEHLDQTEERCSVVFGNRTVSAGVVLIRVKGALSHHHRTAKFVVAMKQTKLREIAGRPACQFLESLILALVVTAPARRVGRLCGRLEFDEGASRRALPHERNIRAADARVSVFGNNGKSWGGRQERHESFEQLLECRGKRRFRNISVRSAKLPYSKRVGLKEIIDGHRILLMCAVLHVIIENCLRTHYRMHVSPRAETNLVAPEASGNLFKTASITHRETE